VAASSKEAGTAAPGSALRLPEVVVEADRPIAAASADEVRARDLELQPRLRPAVVEVMDRCRAAGVTTIGVLTRPSQQP
jgi:hypothetical protein